MTPTRQYIRNVRRLMPVYKRNEKRFLTDLKSDLDSYCDDHPDNSDFESLTRQFGSPKETYVHYLLAQDDKYLMHATQIRGLIAAIILTVCIFISVMAGISVYYSHKMHTEWNDFVNRISEMEHAADEEYNSSAD